MLATRCRRRGVSLYSQSVIASADAEVASSALRRSHARSTLCDGDVAAVAVGAAADARRKPAARGVYRTALDHDVAAREVIAATDPRRMAVAARIKRTVALDG